MELKDTERRILLLTALVLFIFAVLVLRLFQLQLVTGEKYEELSLGNRIRLLPITAARGEIYDRNGRVVATSRPAFTVSLVHMGQEQLPEVVGRVAPILGMSPQEIERRIAAQRGRLFEPVRLKADIDPQMHMIIEEHRHRLPGVVVEVQPVRSYPYGAVAAHVLGYLGEISEGELERLAPKGYARGDIVGKMGVEAVYDEHLRGGEGGRQVEVDHLGRPVQELGVVEPEQGDNLVLTLDIELQRAAERALEASMEELRTAEYNPFPNAYAGAVVALDPRTGEILALASLPAFDPNVFAGGIAVSDWEQLNSNPLHPLTNRAISGEYPPGSAFKMVTATAALETGKVTPSECINCRGVYWVLPKLCWANTRGGHGPINIREAIAGSCNVYFYEAGRRTGIEALAHYAGEYGLGERTGLTDLRSESKGLCPSPEWKRANLPHDPQWYLGDTINAAIGQGFHKYTPLQMAAYAAAIGNGGTRYRPFLVSRVVSPDGKVRAENAPEVLGRAAVADDTLRIIREGMIGVTQPGGTAYSSFRDIPVPVAGKTGTAQTGRPDKDAYGWFVCFAPADDPTIAIAVVVEEGGGGSRAAAPVARDILRQYFGLDEESPGAGGVTAGTAEGD